MQTILGAGGSVADLLAKELKNYTNKIRLVSRSPRKVNSDDELLSADLLDKTQVYAAVEGSDVVYLTAGLPYDYKIWEKQWPIMMQNVIEACLEHQAKLVFFDNIYMYDPSEVPNMTEQAKMNPQTKKGKVRHQLVQMIFSAIEKRSLTALIARCADFYGKDAKNSVLNLLVFEKLKKNQRPNWQCDTSKIHSFTYLPDAAKATAMLGNTADAYGEVWHLPTSDEKLTGQDFIHISAQTLGVATNKPFILTPFLIRIAGLFDVTTRNLVEMQYQNYQDYFFDSSKFCDRFGFTPTTYAEGIKSSLL